MNETRTGGDQRDAICSLVLVQVVLGASLYFNFLSRGALPNATKHLGGEHRCIARALADGRGFSDPFGAPTGPTAWAAPLFPLLMAILFKNLSGSTAVAAVIVTLQSLVTIYAGFLLLRAPSGRDREPGSRPVILALYILAVLYEHYYLLTFTHDHWIVMLWICVFFDLADRLFGRVPGTLAFAAWGVAGGLSVLTSPVLGPVWAGLTVVLAASVKRARQFAISVLIAAAVVAPWMARNTLVFHRLIPVKSNLAFELYQSQCLEPRGVLRQVTALTHPYLCDGRERALYQEVGEMRYLDEKRRAFFESVRQHPLSYFRRVANRLLAATILFGPYDPGSDPVSDLLGWFFHPLPVLGMILTVASRGWSKDGRKVIALVIFAIYLVPYVFISYYIRYSVPLLMIKVLFIFWGLESALRMRRPWG